MKPEAVGTVQYRPRRFRLSETAELIQQVVRAEGTGEMPGTWRVVEDTLTGTLFITTTPAKHRQIRDLLFDLEGVAEGPRRGVRTFKIRRRQVREVLELLQGLLEAGVLGDVSVATGVSPQAAASERASPPGPGSR